jgi:hypothetical protein
MLFDGKQNLQLIHRHCVTQEFIYTQCTSLETHTKYFTSTLAQGASLELSHKAQSAAGAKG